MFWQCSKCLRWPTSASAQVRPVLSFKTRKNYYIPEICKNSKTTTFRMHQKHYCRIHFRQIFSALQRRRPSFFCSFTSNVWSHDINKRNQTNSGTKALRILIFLWRSKMQLSVTSSYIWKWISPGLPSPPFSLASGLAPKLPSPSLSNACHASYTALLVFHNPRSSFSTL